MNSLALVLALLFVSYAAALDHNVKVKLSLDINKENIDHTNWLLSVQSEDGQINNFSYVAEFKPDHSNPYLNLTSHTQAISLPYEVEDIKLVKFYSNSTSTDTFYVLDIEFDPTYVGEMGEFSYKIFFSIDSSEYYYKPMTHNTWYTLDKSV